MQTLISFENQRLQNLINTVDVEQQTSVRKIFRDLTDISQGRPGE